MRKRCRRSDNGPPPRSGPLLITTRVGSPPVWESITRTLLHALLFIFAESNLHIRGRRNTPGPSKPKLYGFFRRRGEQNHGRQEQGSPRLATPPLARRVEAYGGGPRLGRCRNERMAPWFAQAVRSFRSCPRYGRQRLRHTVNPVTRRVAGPILPRACPRRIPTVEEIPHVTSISPAAAHR